jgi:hypothetical protein
LTWQHLLKNTLLSTYFTQGNDPEQSRRAGAPGGADSAGSGAIELLQPGVERKTIRPVLIGH